MVLVSNLGLILVNVIPDDSKYWKLFITLREICSIILAPRMHRSTALMLETLIEEHHQLYIDLFGELKPRFHNMVHYKRILLATGPFISNSCIRMEGKNKELKSITLSTSTSKNLLIGIMYRYQLKLCNLYSVGLNYNDMKTVKPLKKSFEYVKACFPNNENINNINTYDFIEINSCRFQVGEVYVVDLHSEIDLVDFGKIHSIFVCEGEVYFLMYLHESLSYEKKCKPTQLKKMMNLIF